MKFHWCQSKWETHFALLEEMSQLSLASFCQRRAALVSKLVVLEIKMSQIWPSSYLQASELMILLDYGQGTVSTLSKVITTFSDSIILEIELQTSNILLNIVCRVSPFSSFTYSFPQINSTHQKTVNKMHQAVCWNEHN